MRFEEAYEGWTESRLTQEEAARWLGVCDRILLHYMDRYEEEGLEGLIDKRLSQISHRPASISKRTCPEIPIVFRSNQMPVKIKKITDGGMGSHEPLCMGY